MNDIDAASQYKKHQETALANHDQLGTTSPSRFGTINKGNAASR